MLPHLSVYYYIHIPKDKGFLAKNCVPNCKLHKEYYRNPWNRLPLVHLLVSKNPREPDRKLTATFRKNETWR